MTLGKNANKAQKASDSDPSARKALPPGTRLIWSLVFLAVIGSIALRIRYAHSASVGSHEVIDMHEAPAVLETRLAAVPPEQKQAQILKIAQDPSPALRYADIDSLAQLRSPAAIDALEQAFTDSNSEVRKRALEKLIDVDQPRGLLLLLAGLRDHDNWIREDAANQLNMRAGRPGNGVDKKAVPMLMTAITDPNPAVATTAMHTLTKLTGNRWHSSSLDSPAKRQPVIARWQQWWKDAQKTWPTLPELRDVAARQPTRTDPAPSFDVEDLEGKTFQNNDLRGKITLINFWGTWCSPCRAEIPELVKLDQTYRSRKVTLVGLTVADKNRSDVEKWCRENKVDYRQALSTEDVRHVFSIEDVPVSFLIDAQGRIRYRWEGNRDYATFSIAIERLLHEQSSAPLQP